MCVKKIITFYENQHFFTILFVHNFLSRWLNESFRFFCVSYVKILKIGSFWFILQKSIFLFFFVAYRTASILALASSTSELLMERRKICVVDSEWCLNASLMTEIEILLSCRRCPGMAGNIESELALDSYLSTYLLLWWLMYPRMSLLIWWTISHFIRHFELVALTLSSEW